MNNIYAIVVGATIRWILLTFAPPLAVILIVSLLASDGGLAAFAERERAQALWLGYLGPWRSWDAAVSVMGGGSAMWSHYAVPVAYRLIALIPIIVPIGLLALVAGLIGNIDRRVGAAYLQAMARSHRIAFARVIVQAYFGLLLALACVPVAYVSWLVLPTALFALIYVVAFHQKNLPMDI